MSEEQNEAWRGDYESPTKEVETVCLLRIPNELADLFEEMAALTGTQANSVASVYVAVMFAEARRNAKTLRKAAKLND